MTDLVGAVGAAHASLDPVAAVGTDRMPHDLVGNAVGTARIDAAVIAEATRVPLDLVRAAGTVFAPLDLIGAAGPACPHLCLVRAAGTAHVLFDPAAVAGTTHAP